MAVLHTFFDESGKFQVDKVVTFCGFGASSAQLADFDKQWNYQLQRIGMDALHWVKARRCGKPLGRKIGPQTLKDRINDLKPFVDCINDHFGVGVALAHEVAGYTSFPQQSKMALGGSDDPFYVQFLRTVQLLADYAKPDEGISMMCDEDEQTAMHCYGLYKHVRQLDPIAKRKLVAIGFANDRYFPALQAADMLSFLCREQAMLQFHRIPYEYSRFFRYLTDGRGTSSLRWQVSFNDKKTLRKLGRDLAKLQQRKQGSKSKTA